MRKKSKTLRLADELKNWSGPETGGLITACEVELRRLHKLNVELLKAAAEAEDVIEILWVSHHASRADAALEKLRDVIAKANL